MSEQFSLFDDIDRQSNEALERTRAFNQEPTKCLFCGETMRRALMHTNHGIVFNGWCMKALAYHTRNMGRTYTEEARWLESKGIQVGLSRFDNSHWNMHNVELHYGAHYGKCYERGCK